MPVRAIYYWLLLVFASISNTIFIQAQNNEIHKSVYFGGGSYSIDEEQKQNVNDFIQSIEHIQDYRIVLFSYTDNIGSQQYNLWLSQMRSTAVKELLIDLHIDKRLIDIKSFGENNPIYDNKTAEGRVRNRRVDIHLIPITM